MWYAIIGVAAFFFGCLFGFMVIGFFFVGSRQDEEYAASVRIADAKENILKAKKNIKEFEEEYQTSFSDLKRSLAQSDERLSDYAEWAYWAVRFAFAREVERTAFYLAKRADSGKRSLLG